MGTPVATVHAMLAVSVKEDSENERREASPAGLTLSISDSLPSLGTGVSALASPTRGGAGLPSSPTSTLPSRSEFLSVAIYPARVLKDVKLAEARILSLRGLVRQGLQQHAFAILVWIAHRAAPC